MSRWMWAPWLPLALILMHGPGCLSLSGPSSVEGTVGGSLSVRCMYEEEDANMNKYWCKSPCLLSVIVKTSATQREERHGHVTLRDEPAKLTFSVTYEDLREADEGTYYCGVDRILKMDSRAEVVVSVHPRTALQDATRTFPTPAPQAASTTPGPSQPPSESTRQQAPDLHPSTDPGPSSTGSLFSSVHFQLLIFLKVPLLLGMVGAVLGVTWLRKSPQNIGSAV